SRMYDSHALHSIRILHEHSNQHCAFVHHEINPSIQFFNHRMDGSMGYCWAGSTRAFSCSKSSVFLLRIWPLSLSSPESRESTSRTFSLALLVSAAILSISASTSSSETPMFSLSE